MTLGQYTRKIIQIAGQCEKILKSYAPVDTGNLRDTIRLEFTNDGFAFSIVAPYVVYTNEVWLSPQWKGANNPNEGWVNDAYVAIAMYLQQRFTGEQEFEEFDGFEEQDIVGDVVLQYQLEKYGVVS